jgi:hypothetical protein
MKPAEGRDTSIMYLATAHLPSFEHCPKFRPISFGFGE